MMPLLSPLISSAKKKKILIIASSGGGGLIQAANAKEQEIRLEDPDAQIIRKDVLRDWIGGFLGLVLIKMYNSAQKNGNVTVLKFFSVGGAVVDFLFTPYVFFKALATLFKEDIDQIIDTQPLCTSALIKALRVFHWRKGRKICLEKILVDLPTPKATHYFRSIRKLSRADRPYLKITTILPFLKTGETAQEFWKIHCKLPETQVKYEPFYVRQSFRKYHKQPKSLYPLTVKASIKNDEELELIRRSIERGSIEVRRSPFEMEFVIEPQDLVFTILLGSQPAYVGSLNYVRNFIEVAREKRNRNKRAHLFIFCGNHHAKRPSLLKSVSELVGQIPDYPQNFSVIPLSFQTDEIIAPLFHRSQITCTRSGGQTLMELMCVAPKNIWIHSESKKKTYRKEEELLEGIPGWEAANALYMHRVYNARIVTPESCVTHAQNVFFESI